MNTEQTNEGRENTGAVGGFRHACRGCCEKVWQRIRETRQAILAESRDALKVPERLVKLALNEAEALAWQTSYPQLCVSSSRHGENPWSCGLEPIVSDCCKPGPCLFENHAMNHQPTQMATTLDPVHRAGTGEIGLPRVRLTPSRRARGGRAGLTLTQSPPAAVTPPAAAVEPETFPAEAHPGDTLQLYLREIGQVKLLTPEEEIALARRVRRGDQQAREQMITANLRLVVKIARDYQGLGLPLLDLINEGNIGLMKGVQRFDPRKGAKLSSYASLWIKQAIRRALSNTSKTIRLPVHVVDKMALIRKAETRLHETLDREPTDEEVAARPWTERAAHSPISRRLARAGVARFAHRRRRYDDHLGTCGGCQRGRAIRGTRSQTMTTN